MGLLARWLDLESRLVLGPSGASSRLDLPTLVQEKWLRGQSLHREPSALPREAPEAHENLKGLRIPLLKCRASER